MENRTLANFSNASLNDDGLQFNLTIDTLQRPVPIEASVADIGKTIHLLSKVSWAAGHIQRLPQHFGSDGTLSLQPVDATRDGARRRNDARLCAGHAEGQRVLPAASDNRRGAAVARFVP